MRNIGTIITHFHFQGLQKLSMSLMLPVAILPVAGICLALGTGLHIEILSTAGSIIFGNLPLLFGIGIAIGLTDDGTSALSVVTGYLMLIAAMGIAVDVSPEKIANDGEHFATVLGIHTLDVGVLGGMIVGLVTVVIFKRFHKTELPSFLEFFSGKRLVPILVTAVCLVLGFVLPTIWMPVQHGLSALSTIATSGDNVYAASYIYAFVERALLPTGLHHIWNVPFYYNFGEYIDATGQLITGDIPVLFAQIKDGVPLTAGFFIMGHFPVTMFGLPSLALAIYHEAKPENRSKVKGALLSGVVTAAITGITEPLESSYMFAAPLLYIIHCFIYAFSYVVTNLVLVHIRQPYIAVLIVGAGYAPLYYFLTRFLIRKFDLKTPGREDITLSISKEANSSNRAGHVIEALGGLSNLITVDACASRLRCRVRNVSLVDKTRLMELGAYGLVQLGSNGIQVIFGGKSQNIREEINALRTSGDCASQTPQ